MQRTRKWLAPPLMAGLSAAREKALRLAALRLELAAFLCGALVMVLELDGARVLAPYFGGGIFVWSSLIGVILASLSLGYFLGGRAADESVSLKGLGTLILLAGTAVAFTACVREPLLEALRTRIHEPRLAPLLSVLILFAPASVAFGMVSPYAVRLKLLTGAKTGSAIGNLYALSTLGSILGTFATGFYLIPELGNAKILQLVAAVASLTGVLLAGASVFHFAWGILLIAAAAVWGGPNGNYVVDLDSRYSRLIVQDGISRKNFRVRLMRISSFSPHSVMYLDYDRHPVLPIIRAFRLVEHFAPEAKRVLMIGAGAYSSPRDLLERNPRMEMDVVELDPMVTKLAKEYFHLTDHPRLHSFHQDGRYFVNQAAPETYDAIVLDAFSSETAPFQLASVEAVRQFSRVLKPNGVVLVNIASLSEGPASRFFRSQVTAYRSAFPHLFVLPVSPEDIPRQNVLLVASKAKQTPTLDPAPKLDAELKALLARTWTKPIPADVPAPTDDRSSVELDQELALME